MRTKTFVKFANINEIKLIKFENMFKKLQKENIYSNLKIC